VTGRATAAYGKSITGLSGPFFSPIAFYIWGQWKKDHFGVV
jgi:hypothetical protein